MEKETIDVVVDLDKSKEQIIADVAKVLSKHPEKVKEGRVALNFLVKKKGEKPESVMYNLNKDTISEAEKNYVFPIVLQEVLSREFNPNIAKNEKLRNHLIEELQKDPYWSERVVKLIKTLKDKKGKVNNE